jgi:membrane protein YdbS with pleckstrin-like domain
MTIDQMRDAIKTRIWQAMAGSGVNLSAIARADLDRLVEQISREVLLELDELLSDSAAIPEIRSAPPSAPDEETVLWEGRPFLSFVEHYRVTNERVRILTGLLGRQHEDIEFARVKDVDWKQGVSERILGIGDILLNTADATRPQAVLRNVKHPEQVHEIVRRAMLEIRKKYHIIFEQEM